MLTTLKSYLVRLAIASLFSAAIGGSAYAYFTYTQKKIQELSAQVSAYEINIRQCEETIENVKADKERIERETVFLQTRIDQAEVYQNDLIRKLQRHDLTRLTLEKPGLIETRVNNGTKEIFEELESISRDP